MWFEISLGGKNLLPADGTGSYYANDHWTTNGMDWMSYIYINGESAYKITEQNAGKQTYTGEDFPITMGGWYAPVSVYLDGSVLQVIIPLTTHSRIRPYIWCIYDKSPIFGTENRAINRQD